MSMIPINAEEFDEIIKEDKETCVMVFHKESCSVCKHLVPVAEKVSGEFEGKIKFYSLSVSDPEVLARFKEMKLLGVPQTVFIDKGEKKEVCPAISAMKSFAKKPNTCFQAAKVSSAN